jgi:prephenate dehydrogenase
MGKKVVVMDGQGGKIGCLLIEQLKKEGVSCEICAIGANTAATAAMLKAGASYGATGENPAVVNCRDADCVIGPLGIVVADSLYGEITPKMAVAVGQSAAEKILLPISRCKNHVAGFKELPMPELISEAVRLAVLVLT